MNIKEFSNRKREDFRKEINQLTGLGYPSPCLAVIIVGNDPASETYVRNKGKACEKAGIINRTIAMPGNTTTQEVIGKIQELNADPSVNGILVQLPLPKDINTYRVINAIDVKKDVDGFTPGSIGGMFSGSKTSLIPCTPLGGLRILDEIIPWYDQRGLNAVVIGRSREVGQPFAKLLQDRDMTVTICHSKTTPEDLKFYAQHADVLVTAAGKARMITADMVKPGAVVIDVGINYDEEGKLCGDVDYNEVSKVAKFVSPVPGGCGPMTITSLLENTLTLYYRQIDPTARPA